MVPAAVAFKDTNRHQDGNEWVGALVEAIENELPLEQKEEWKALFNFGIGGSYKCTPAGHTQPKGQAVFSTLRLEILDEKTKQPLTTMDHALMSYFADEQIEKLCHEEGCDAIEAIQKNFITYEPSLLLIQYKRFSHLGTQLTKLTHPVRGNTTIQLNKTRYELVGVLQHLGEEFATGHYTSVTR
jgi:uncharacterized UBP type Zn finger protein